LRQGWKKPQTVKRQIPTVAQFEAIVADIRSQECSSYAQVTDDFVEFLGLAGLGQAEASALTWGDIDWQRHQINVRRQKTDTHFQVPIYDHLRPLLERMNNARRGKRSPASLVFKIKDAKRALGFACKRLKFPAFCQRSLRQHLIGRLWRAGVDRKLIAQWQGHQDGGQLILDTYTQVFGSDDDEKTMVRAFAAAGLSDYRGLPRLSVRYRPELQHSDRFQRNGVRPADRVENNGF